MPKSRKSKTPNFPPATILHLRLDGLWKNTAFLAQTPEQIQDDLAAVTRGHKPEHILQALFAAYAGSSETARARLDALLPPWLQAHDYVNALRAQSISPTQARWLVALGEVAPVVPVVFSAFVAAFGIDDGSQANLIITWRSKPRATEVRAMSFLIDYNPPWDGAVKDIIRFPQQPLDFFRDAFQTMSQGIRTPLHDYTAAEAKHLIITALQANRAQNIRLPQDLITSRDIFLAHILPLPDAADTPTFTVEDFDFLSREGERSETIQAFEQTVGRRLRMEDGKEMFVDAAIANDDFFDGFLDEADDVDKKLLT